MKRKVSDALNCNSEEGSLETVATTSAKQVKIVASKTGEADTQDEDHKDTGPKNVTIVINMN